MLFRFELFRSSIFSVENTRHSQLQPDLNDHIIAKVCGKVLPVKSTHIHPSKSGLYFCRWLPLIPDIWAVRPRNSSLPDCVNVLSKPQKPSAKIKTISNTLHILNRKNHVTCTKLKYWKAREGNCRAWWSTLFTGGQPAVSKFWFLPRKFPKFWNP